MRKDIQERLEALVSKMTEGEEAWGPTSDVSDDESAAGEGGAENVSTIDNAFDSYILGIVASILEEYELDEEEAIDYVFYVADDLAEQGELPTIPEGEDPQETAEWLGKAQSMLFAELVMAALESEAGEDGDEDTEADEE